MNEEFNYAFQDLAACMRLIQERLKLAVVYGGDKSKPHAVIYQTQNTRSWKSYEIVARDIMDALTEIGYRNVTLMPDDMSLFDSLKKEGIQFVWLNTGGVQGYMPVAHAPALLEMAGMPYVGHNPLNAALLDTKHIFKYMCQKLDIPTAPFVVWSRASLSASREKDLESLRNLLPDYTGPFVVKPTSGRASLLVNVVDRIEDVLPVVNDVYHATGNYVIIEKYLSGREFCVSVCGPVLRQNGNFVKHDSPFAFSVLERVFEPGERIFTSMDQKPITQNRTRLVCPKKEAELYERLTFLARHIYTGFFLQTLVRIDFREDEKGNLYVLETNPKPDLKRPSPEVTSLTCLGLSEQSMSYHDLVESILANGLDYLLTYRQNNIGHILELLRGTSA